MDSQIRELFDLSGKVAVVTGASGGIGRATAETLAAAGADVVLADVSEAALRETAAQVGARGRRAVVAPTDVRRRAQVEALVSRAVDELGRIDIMANIAGVLRNSPIVDLTDEELDLVLDTNLKGVFYGNQAALRAMIPRKSGCIINISSQAIDSSGANLAAYGMSKAAVAMLTKVAASEGAPHNIRVNAVAPGWIETPMTSYRWKNEEERQQVVAAFAQATPLKRAGKPEYIAHTILYLCSEAASWVTGQILRPNGGSAMPW
jgi:3-oxoacyl-[acyl-carrier protein] reductase